MHRLERYYSSDADWNDFVKLYAEDYLDENARILSSKLNGAIDLAIVIYGKRGIKEGEWWIEQEVPMLDKIRPLDCLDDPELLRRLRECLMRMP
ncbi:hypothetical protein [Gibbsiella quercinecans]|uniref:Antitoxin Xre/MbcA/ParS-like toxin-binding domain-containing protein n=1 Tax=Gibbsiella quercinecans TaxID=929813 RepID=A0A250B6H1_9GAMM|nr:hypothetical protein [Gibbsiella quercinecans]ATA21759.1 hypothetical protein AWC35_21820 [Gibbsiella quercinecans]RLM03795.1 hypothetical protein BIY30_21740 [Gibbsiella quercinecans]